MPAGRIEGFRGIVDPAAALHHVLAAFRRQPGGDAPARRLFRPMHRSRRHGATPIPTSTEFAEEPSKQRDIA
jgi:hypothetical protein